MTTGMDCDFKGEKFRDGPCERPANRFFFNLELRVFRARCRTHAKRIENVNNLIETDEDTFVVARVMES